MRESALSVEHLTVSYGDHDVVRDVSFTVQPGEVVALVGRSGAGKSSIIAAIMDLLPRDARQSGTIRVAGKERTDVAEGKWRNRIVALVPQNPFSWFNPMIKMHKQLTEVTRDRSLVGGLLTAVGFDDPSRIERSRPDQLSGGMRQRAAIAASMAHDPPLLLADEPTSALDSDSQQHILGLLRSFRERGQAVLLVSHEVAVVEQLADRVLFIEDGQLIDMSEYVISLDERPPMSDVVPLLRADSLCISFPKQPIVDALDLVVGTAETVAITGPSGRGKSTLCRVLAGLSEPQRGRVTVGDVDVHEVDRARRAQAVQLVFQDVRGSLDERMTAYECVDLPLGYLDLTEGERNQRVKAAFDIAGVDFHLRKRKTSQLSGGEAQRVALARALALRPQLLILDEPFSALDMRTRNALVSRLITFQEEFGTSIIAVLHSDDVVRGFAHRVVEL